MGPEHISSKGFRERLRGEQCVYCGEVATTEDHFPPKTCTVHGLLLPACRECNSALGTTWAYDFDERCHWLNRWLRAKYARYLAAPSWSGEEMRELGRTLRTTVKRFQRIRDTTLRRVAWNPTAYLATIDSNKVFDDMLKLALEEEGLDHAA